MKKIITHSAKETIAYGKKIAVGFRGGEVLALSGNLGAGKTTLIKGIAKGLGIKKPVTSPTFIIMNLYKLKTKNQKLKQLVHIDCYRLHSAKDILGIGAEEYFGRPDTVVVIEWPERIKKILPKKTIRIRISTAGEKKRVFILQ